MCIIIIQGIIKIITVLNIMRAPHFSLYGMNRVATISVTNFVRLLDTVKKLTKIPLSKLRTPIDIKVLH